MMEIYKLSDSTQKYQCVDRSDHSRKSAVFKITDIRQALKNQNRVNIYINGKYEFSLDIAQVVDFKIRVGLVLSDAEIKKYRQASEFGKVYQQTLEWVLIRPRSLREVQDYLKRKRLKREMENKHILENQKRPKEECQKFKLKTRTVPIFSEEEAQAVIKRLSEKSYIDDQKFTEYYIQNRFVKKGVSRKRIEQELRQKGISNDIIENTLQSLGRNDDEEIKKIIARKKSKYPPEKLITYLVRQGFSYQQAKEAVCEMDSQS